MPNVTYGTYKGLLTESIKPSNLHIEEKSNGHTQNHENVFKRNADKKVSFKDLNNQKKTLSEVNTDQNILTEQTPPQIINTKDLYNKPAMRGNLDFRVFERHKSQCTK